MFMRCSRFLRIGFDSPCLYRFDDLAYTLIVYYMAGLRTDSIQYACWCVLINIVFQFTM